MTPAPALLVFDVNETLLDLEALSPFFQRMFGSPGVMREWFAQLVLYSEALTLAGAYAPFSEIGGAALRMIASIRSVEVGNEDLEELKETVAALPAHSDALESLAELKDAGFRLFTLTNNPAKTAARQLETAGLSQFFERQFSVEDVGRFKPAPETYRSVAEALQAPCEDLWLVACHAWDTLGAGAAGWASALILRDGNAPLGVGPQPTLVVKDLRLLSAALLTRYARSARGA